MIGAGFYKSELIRSRSRLRKVGVGVTQKSSDSAKGRVGVLISMFSYQYEDNGQKGEAAGRPLTRVGAELRPAACRPGEVLACCRVAMESK